MKKRILSLLVIAAFCLSLLPQAVLAASAGSVSIGALTLNGSTDAPAYACTSADGTVTTTGADESTYNIKWDGATLTLRNATVNASDAAVNEGDAVGGIGIGVGEILQPLSIHPQPLRIIDAGVRHDGREEDDVATRKVGLDVEDDALDVLAEAVRGDAPAEVVDAVMDEEGIRVFLGDVGQFAVVFRGVGRGLAADGLVRVDDRRAVFIG